MKYIFNVVSIKTDKFTLVMNGLPLRLKSKNVFVVYLLFWLIKWLINITILRFPKRLHMVFIRRNAWLFFALSRDFLSQSDDTLYRIIKLGRNKQFCCFLFIFKWITGIILFFSPKMFFLSCQGIVLLYFFFF